MIKSFLHLIALALVAMGFVACSEESRLGIKKPLVFPTMDNYGKIYYAIQSQDENTIIEDYVVNRGNCGDDDFKQFYLRHGRGRELGYGETMKIDIGKCDSSNIMEVQLILNGGKKVTYNLKGGY